MLLFSDASGKSKFDGSWTLNVKKGSGGIGALHLCIAHRDVGHEAVVMATSIREARDRWLDFTTGTVPSDNMAAVAADARLYEPLTITPKVLAAILLLREREKASLRSEMGIHHTPPWVGGKMRRVVD